VKKQDCKEEQLNKHGWGGARVPAPDTGRKVGRRYLGGGKELPVRLTPWLIMAFELKNEDLKRTQSDASRIKEAVFKAVLFLKACPEDPIAKLQPRRSPHAANRLGWSTGIRMTNIWCAPSVEAVIESVRQEDEDTSHLLKRLLVVCAALEGLIEKDDEHLPSFEEYQRALKRKPGQTTGIATEETEIQIRSATHKVSKNTSRNRRAPS
jgi:hypothetical protein